MIKIAHQSARVKQEVIYTYVESTTLAFFSIIQARDPYTAKHSLQVAYYGRELAQGLGLNPKECQNIYLAGLLHDIGKIGISDLILHKKGQLSPSEKTIVSQHVTIGCGVLERAGEVFAPITQLVRHHHEWWNGGGYPDQLKGDNIPLGAQILSITDAYDAMTSNRPYRRALRSEDAHEELKRCQGSQFNPHLVEVFLSIPKLNLLQETQQLL